MTLDRYVAIWFDGASPAWKINTARYYQYVLRGVVADLGARELTSLTRAELKAWVGRVLRVHGVARARVALRVLGTVLNAAVDDEVIAQSPVGKLGRSLKLTPRPGRGAGPVKAMTQAQLLTFLAQTRARRGERWFLVFYLMADTGLRPGEAVELRRSDLDFDAGRILVQRTKIRAGLRNLPKSGVRRLVEMRPRLAAMLQAHLARQDACARYTDQPVPPWLFPSRFGRGRECWHQDVLSRVVHEVCQHAGLPTHFTAHSLRHTFASLALQRGEAIQWVQQQLGHASITLTVDLYGSWHQAERKVGGTLDDILDAPA